MGEVTIDGRGLTCAQVGSTADIIATNPGSEKDVPAQVKNLGSELVKPEVLNKSCILGGKKYHYHIRRLR